MLDILEMIRENGLTLVDGNRSGRIRKDDLHFSRTKNSTLEYVREFKFTDNLFNEMDKLNEIISPSHFKSEDQTVEMYYFITQLPKVNKRIENFINFHEKIYKRLLNTWRGRIQDAKKKNIPYDEAAFYSLIVPKKCPVIGLEIDLEGKNTKIGGGDDSPSFDKMVPTKGYVKGNIQIISFAANRMLNNLGEYPERISPFINYLQTKELKE
jgi:hypothetical protein